MRPDHTWRWSTVFVVLAVAGVVAIWPRGGPDRTATAAPPPPAGARTTAGPQGDTDLAPLRQRAQMRPCPAPRAGAPAARGPLAGVVADCLGAPGSVDLGAALAGQTVLLNLWASWCVPCREEMPVLAAYADSPGSVPVAGINVKEPAAAGLAFVAEVGVRYPSFHDADGAVLRALRVPPVLPVNYLVRPDGSVRRITDPLVFRTPDEVRAAVARVTAS